MGSPVGAAATIIWVEGINSPCLCELVGLSQVHAPAQRPDPASTLTKMGNSVPAELGWRRCLEGAWGGWSRMEVFWGSKRRDQNLVFMHILAISLGSSGQSQAAWICPTS